MATGLIRDSRSLGLQNAALQTYWAQNNSEKIRHTTRMSNKFTTKNHGTSKKKPGAVWNRFFYGLVIRHSSKRAHSNMSPKSPPSAPSLAEWLRNARGPYLNFLRNLTPQILLASLAWVLASKLNFTKVDFANYLPTIGFFAFFALFVYAVYSNISLFLSEVFPGLIPWIKEQENELESAGISRWRIPRHLLVAALKERKLEVTLAAFAMIMLQFVFAGVFVASIGAAVSLIRAAYA